MDLFNEIAITNRAYCQANGLSADLYAPKPVFKVKKAKHLKHWPRTPLQQLEYIEEQIKQGCYQPEGD